MYPIVNCPYLLAYVVLGLLLVLWAFLHTTLGNLYRYCSAKCKKGGQSAIHKNKLKQNFF